MSLIRSGRTLGCQNPASADIISVSRHNLIVSAGEKNDDIKSRPYIVVVRNATKNYGNCKVIDGLNMTIKQGTIYSFLGSSGCGKSTTLGCIVGLSKFTTGNVWIFGREPGPAHGSVPGKSLGYMPQDYSLYTQLSIEETLIFFGTMHGMDRHQISEALVFFTNLFQLPRKSGLVDSLSGGQKRRVSLIVSIMHNPPLLVLDEPTVGMDPLLCENVVKYLTHLTRTMGTTVLITTHYIEAARHSDTVGVMRNGKLIAEKSPTELLVEHEQMTLEGAILKLCKEEVQSELNNKSKYEVIHDHDEDDQSGAGFSLLDDQNDNGMLGGWQHVAESFTRTKALVTKNTFVWQQSFLMLNAAFVFPVKLLVIIYFCFGTPKYVHFGVVNDEVDSHSNCENLTSASNQTCEMTLWSCRYLDQLTYPEFVLHHYDSIEEAEMEVHSGNIWGFLFFSRNFSDELFQRGMTNAEKVDLISFNSSIVRVRMDISNSIVAMFTEYELLTRFGNFLSKLFLDCNLDPKRIEYPLKFNEPILGKDIPMNYYPIGPTVVTQMLIVPIVSSGAQFVLDKQQGTIQRSLVAGTKLWEIFLSYAITELGIGFLRLILLYGTVVFLIGMKLLGSLVLEGVLCLLVGCVGVAFGFMFGMICTDGTQVAVVAIAVYIPIVTLSSIIWPLEGMTYVLRQFAYALPCTLPTESIRSMVSRGWGLENENVWLGFVSAISYFIIIFFGVIVLSKRFKP